VRLLALGIDSTEERVYLHMLRRDDCAPDGIADSLGLESANVRIILTKLLNLSLIKTAGPGFVRAADPTLAIEQLVESRLSELNSESHRVSAARRHIPVLEKIRRNRDYETGFAEIERVDGLESLRERIDEISFFSSSELLAIQPGPGLTRAAIDAARPLDRRALRRRMRMRTIVHEESLTNEHMLLYLDELASLGAEVRVAAETLERVLIFDRSVAVVPIDPATTGQGGLIVRQPGLLTQILLLFSRCWESTVPLHPQSQEPGPVALTPLEQQTLAVMAEADKDLVGARIMGVSLRTYRGYVAKVLEKLNASSRFQAALIAKEFGLL
jgi:DNA-binding CsgD family transcriptional regulator